MSALGELQVAFEESGLKKEKANQIATILMSREFIRETVATKEDILLLENRLEKEISSVKSELKEDIYLMRSEVASVKTEIATLKTDVTSVKEDLKSIKGSITGLYITVIGAVLLTWILPTLAKAFEKLTS